MESAHWDVPANAVSGIYLAKLIRDDTQGASHIAFIVRDDASISDLLFKTSDATWQAYNVYGGNSLYVGSVAGFPSGHAPKVSYNRPFYTRNGGGGGGASEDWLFNAEYPMVRWLEANGYDVTYTTDVDADRRGNLIANHRVFLSVGHDEYWSGAERANVQAARDAGTHLAFFSGNEIYWKTRWEPSIDGSGTPYRTLVCYKEGTLGENVCGGKCDPLADTWTGLWRDGCAFTPPADGCSPENALSGQISWDGTTSNLRVPDAYKNHRFWRNTAVAGLGSGQTLDLPPGTLGYEWDWQQYTEHYPAGRVLLSTTVFNGKTHHLSLYRAPSGALVFGAGTVQWSWGLDSHHDRGNAAPSLAMQQATVNLFADMGAQPASLQTVAGLVAAVESSDATPPASTIGFPASGASLPSGTAVIITGTATDAVGLVAGVEVSVDGGATWHAATGTTSWTYAWTPDAAGSVTIKSRAFDDLANLEAAGAGPAPNVVTVTVTPGSPTACPCDLFGTEAPTGPAVTDNQPIEVGVKFRPSVDGNITGIRFYKGSANTGTHIGHLWTSGGVMLGEATFTGETGQGWQTATFASPVAVTANVLYVASYHSEGYFSSDPHYFATPKVSGPLTAIANDDPAGGNGVYAYSATSAFPTNSPAPGAYDAPNYWVDVVFDVPGGPDQTPPWVSATAPGNNSVGVAANAAVTATFSEALDLATITTATFELRDAGNGLVPASVEYDAPSRTATLTPGTLLATSAVYTARLIGGATDPRIKDLAGNALGADYAWSFTTAAPDLTPPAVSAVSPTSGAGGVAPTVAVTATFDEALSPGTVNTTTFELRDALNAVVPATVAYNVYTRTVTLTPLSPLAAGPHTARVVGGGTDPRVKDLAGNALAADYSWSFTITDFNCPCTIWSPSTVPGTVSDPDARALELGVKFRAAVDGYITGVRFYKGSTNTGTHVGSLWSSTGTSLASATFTGETASGWQEVSFGSPVAITAGTTYVASYHTSTGHYSQDTNYFTSGVDAPPLRALSDGEDGPNGLYALSSSPTFPTADYLASNYWVDVVFATSVGPDVTAPTVVARVPSSGATAVAAGSSVTATFSEAIDAATVDGTTFELRDPANALVGATVTYSAAERMATLAPTGALAYSTIYTATLEGGAADPRIKDAAGNALAADVTWSFTTQAEPPPPPTEGPGGPILVLSAASNPFSRYYVEILRAEGLNAFTAMDISLVTPAVLAAHDVAILGEFPLTAPQVTMIADWTTAGGTLVAMRPDAQLAGLLGITPAAGSLADQYLLVNTASGPGAGIVGETIQFHGAADLYTLSGATALATLYSNATQVTPGANPAVTVRDVGTSGGQAVAFTYDLARSVVYTRQGNPAWINQKRDGAIPPIRSDDLFYPDWVNLDKVHIPQADEQQRLLANVITLGNLDRKPLPRFWYLPKGLKAAIVMTGDNHGDGGMRPRFDKYMQQSPGGCSPDDWECVRATGYLYVGGGFPDTAAARYHSYGFETALHVNTGCASVPYAQYEQAIIDDLAGFAAVYPSIPLPQTHRTHCIAWTDWTTPAEVEALHGMRLDTNYYYWPYAWFQGRSGMFTGSGIPMRFAKEDGTIIDCYQATTQMTDDALSTFTTFCNEVLDRAQGPEGYYGVFTTNLHFDNPNHAGSDQIVASAQAHGVPVVSAKQMLDWLDGRNNSSFANLVWAGNTLSFAIAPATGSRNMRAMLPTQASVGQLTGITRNATPIALTTQVIKGIEYAFFPADAGDYVATYLVDETAPVVTSVVATPHDDGTATVTWTTNEAADSRVDYGAVEGSPDLNVASAALVTSHSVTLTGLAPSTAYYFRVTSADAASNATTEPPTASPQAGFTTPAPVCFVDDTAAQFAGGTPDPSTLVATAANGEVILEPAAGAEFTTLPPTSEWQTFPFEAGGAATISAGRLIVDGARFNTEPTTTTYSPGTSVEFAATFNAIQHQYVGFGGGNDATGPGGMFYGAPWAMFGTGTAGAQVLARVNLTGALIDYPIPLSLLGSSHKYRIDWTTAGVDFYVDDAHVHSEVITIPGPMRVAVSDLVVGAPALSMDWIRITPFASSGSFVSRVYDGVTPTQWGEMTWTASLPAGTSVQMLVRQGDTATPDGSWTGFVPVTANGAVVGGTSRYLQYRADLATTVPTSTPEIQTVHVSCASGPDGTAPAISGITATPGVGGTSAVIGWTTNELATSSVDYGTAPEALSLNVSSPALVGTHAVTLTGLTMNTPYYYRVTSTDGSNNTSIEPPLASAPLGFTTQGPPCATDATAADFSSGTPGVGTYVSETTDGEVILQPTEGAEFSGASLPAGWMSGVYGGSPAVIGGGHVSVDGAYAATTALYGSGRSVEFVATFDASAAGQHAGFGTDLNLPPWAIFSTASGGILQARTNNGSETNQTIPGVTLGVPHRFRIDWTGTQLVYWIDGVAVATHTAAIGASMRPIVSDGPTGGTPMQADWVRLTPYPATGSYTSRVFDAGGPATWGQATWTSDVPAGTSLAMLERHGNTPVPDGTWSGFIAIPASGASLGAAGRYLQYRADLGTGDVGVTPALLGVAIACSSTPDGVPPVITGIAATPATDGVSATVSWTTDEPANSRVEYGTTSESLTSSVEAPAFVTSHLLPLTGLSPSTTYYYRVTSADVAANPATSPAPPATLGFTTPAAPCPTDVTAADFGLGTVDASTVISLEGDGEVILQPAGVMTEFAGTSLPVDWHSGNFANGGTTVVSGGQLVVNGAHASNNLGFGPGRSLEFVATFAPTTFQNVGFAADSLFSAPWVVIGMGGATNRVFARTSSGTEVELASSTFGTPHRYRIDWRAITNDFRFYVDDVLIPTPGLTFTVSGNMGAIVSDYNVGGDAVSVDWLRVTPYAGSGTFESRVIDGGGPTTWGAVTWNASTPAGTSLSIYARTGNVPIPDGAWSPYDLLTNGAAVGANSRYVQYRADLASTAPSYATPVLRDLAIACVAGPDLTPPVITNVVATPATDGLSATVTWTTDERASSRVDYGTDPGVLSLSVLDGAAVRSHSLLVTGLTPGATYHFRVRSVDGYANQAFEPDPPASPLSFTTPMQPCFVDDSDADFGAGTLTNTAVAVTADGEVVLAAVLSTEFSGASLPADWTSVPWTGGTSTVSVGSVTVDGARLTSPIATGFGRGRVMEFVATFGAATFQNAGFGAGDNSLGSTGMFATGAAPWAMFGTAGSSTTLYARTNPGGTFDDVPLAGAFLGAPHLYRIEWRSDNTVEFFIDGVSRAIRTPAFAMDLTMRPGISDYNTGGPAVVVDWLRVTPYAAAGTFDSRVYDSGSPSSWGAMSWSADLPAGTGLSLSVRKGNTPTPDATWTPWTPVPTSGANVGGVGRYIQYSAALASNPGLDQTPALRDVAIVCGPCNTAAPTVIADLASTATGNAGGGRAYVRVDWGGVTAGQTVAVYRKAFGDHPLYRTGPGGVPPAPATPSEAVTAGWTLTGVTTPGGLDAPPTRGFWYHVAFTTNACGLVSGPSNSTNGALDYVLGDVSDGTNVCAAGGEAGNGIVNTPDLSALGARYGQSFGPTDDRVCFDVGPTVDYGVRSRPAPDGALDFEDLVVYALNYEVALGPAATARASATHAAASRDELSLVSPAGVRAGDSFDVILRFRGTGAVHALSSRLGWDPAIAEFVGVVAGTTFSDAGGMALSPEPGTVDVAVLGTAFPGITGDVEVAVATFRALRDGDPLVRVAKTLARDAANRPVTLNAPAPPPTPVVHATMLGPVFPNPFRASLNVSFALAREARVKLVVFDLAGRAVRHLEDGTRAAGAHVVTWDGRGDAGLKVPAGLYVVRFEAGEIRQTRRIQLIR